MINVSLLLCIFVKLYSFLRNPSQRELYIIYVEEESYEKKMIIKMELSGKSGLENYMGKELNHGLLQAVFTLKIVAFCLVLMAKIVPFTFTESVVVEAIHF